jgi:hypothetical protein
MTLSELRAKIQAAGDIHSYELSIAAPDSDGEDVDLASVGRVDIDADAQEVRLYPASTSTDVDSVDPEPFLGMLMSQLPSEASPYDDFRLVVEIPLLRDGSGTERVSLADICAMQIGLKSEEVWLLVRPAAEYANGLLPT